MPVAHNPQYKQDVLAFYASHPEMTKRQICKDFGLSTKTLYNWLKDDHAARNATTNGSLNSQGGGGVSVEEARKLSVRNRELEMENLILRKAAAYFAKEVLPKGSTLS